MRKLYESHVSYVFVRFHYIEKFTFISFPIVILNRNKYRIWRRSEINSSRSFLISYFPSVSDCLLVWTCQYNGEHFYRMSPVLSNQIILFILDMSSVQYWEKWNLKFQISRSCSMSVSDVCMIYKIEDNRELGKKFDISKFEKYYIFHFIQQRENLEVKWNTETETKFMTFFLFINKTKTEDIKLQCKFW